MLALGFAFGWLCRWQLWLHRHLHLAQLLWVMKVHGLRHVRAHLRATEAYGLLVGHVQLRPTWLHTRLQLMRMLVLMLVLMLQMPLLALAALSLPGLGVRFAQARRCGGRSWTCVQFRLRPLAVPADGSTALPATHVFILIRIVLALVCCLTFVVIVVPCLIIIIVIIILITLL